MSERDERRALVVNLLRLAAFGVALYYSLPGDSRPPVAVHAYRIGARGAQLVADRAQQLSLWCRSKYWKAVRP